METLFQPESLVALLTLTFLEIVLGIDNVIFISIVSNKLPEFQRTKTRTIGLSLALIFRIALLLGITWIIGFTKPLFSVLSWDVSGRDLILLGGGIFLLFKSTMEIHHKMEGEHNVAGKSIGSSMLKVITQIILLDLIFSFDSILTAIGLTQEVLLMIIAIILAMFVMLVFAGKISAFIQKHPTLEILALSFLILIGFMLVIESFGYHVPKGYIYFAVFFSVSVEAINIKMRGKRKASPVELNKRISEE